MYVPCRRGGCKRLAPMGAGPYCTTHKRANSNQRGYDYSWSLLSKAMRQTVGHCEWPNCNATTDLTVDHIDGNTHNRMRHNLRVLCRAHNTAHRNRYNKTLQPR